MQSIPRRSPQIVELRDGVELIRLSSNDRPDRARNAAGALLLTPFLMSRGSVGLRPQANPRPGRHVVTVTGEDTPAWRKHPRAE
jgi:hypothetical protein